MKANLLKLINGVWLMNVIKTYIHIGIKEEFCVLHASDTHIQYADERDSERKLELAKRRKSEKPEAMANLDFIREKAIREQRTLIYTGDLIDFVSELNFEKAKEFADSIDIFMTAGNHEFSHYLGEAKEDAAYRNLTLPRVQELYKNDIRCSSRIINGVNFVAIDNSYYLIEELQLDYLIEQTKRNFPVILICHVPLFTKELYDIEVIKENDPANLMSVPEELMINYSSHRYEQQEQDEITEKAYDFIVNCKNIKAILAGHIHKDYEGKLTDDIIQVTTDCNTIREIYID